MLSAFTKIKKLKRNFSLFDAIKIYLLIKNNAEKISISNNQVFYLRKNTKDYETFDEVFYENIYNLPLPIEPTKIIDGGANIGLATRFFKLKYPKASIVVIEIDKDNINMISKNLESCTNTTILNKGLFNRKAYFKVEDPFNATNSFVVKEVTNSEDYDIESVTISEIMDLKEWDSVDILKLDIEGAEKQLFESNYNSWLPKVKVIMIETHDRMVPKCSITVMKALDEFDFGLYTTTEGGTLVYYNKSLLNN